MGERKRKLLRADRYGLLKAADLAAQMIGEYERARDGIRELRVESLEEAIWDDVVATFDGRVDRWQVKRLREPLGREDLVEILAAAGSMSNPTTTRLQLGVARLVEVTKKKAEEGFGLGDLAQLCQEARKPGLVPCDFEAQEKDHACYSFVAASLGADADTIISVLRRLWVHELGLEEALLVGTVAHLNDVFLNAEEVAKQLFNWFVRHPDGAIAVTVDLLYREVVDIYGRRDPGRPRWIHLDRDRANVRWEVRGSLALDEVVSSAWGTGSSIRLQLAAAPFRGCAASASLARLVLHQSSSAMSEAADPNDWHRHGMILCGDTLGRFGENPNVTFNAVAVQGAGTPRVRVSELELAEKLAGFMNESLWSSYASSVAKLLHEENIADDLRSAMKAAWSDWYATLDPIADKRMSFLSTMLATTEEWTRTGFDVAVRAGRLRVDDLARSTVIALAIVSALKCRGVNASIVASNEVDNLELGTIPAHVIALNAASHPSSHSPIRISDAPRALLEREKGVAILGTVGEAARELFDVARQEGKPFHVSDNAGENYLGSGAPFPLLTASPLLRLAMAQGLAATAQHVFEALEHMNSERMRELRQAMMGASAGG